MIQTILAAANLLTNAGFAIYAWRRRSPSVVCFTALAALFGAAQLLESIVGVPVFAAGFDPLYITYGQTIVLTTSICLGFGQFAFRGRRRRVTRRFTEWPETTCARVRLFCAILSSVGYVALLFFGPSSMSDMVHVNRMTLRSQGQSFLLSAARALPVFTTVAVYLALACAKRSWLILAVSIVQAVIAAAVFGDRSFILYAFSPILFYLVADLKSRLNAQIMFLGLAVLLIVFVIGGLHELRWQQARTVDSAVEIARSGQTFDFLLSSKASDWNIRYVLYEAVAIYPKEQDWLYGNTYVTMALFWLPRRWAGSIKTDTMYHFAFALSGNTRVYDELDSAHPTLPGDLYINFGPAFFLGALAWGYVFRIVDQICDSQVKSTPRIVLGGVWVLFLCLAVRGSIYQPFANVMMCLAVVPILRFTVEAGRPAAVRLRIPAGRTS